MKGLLGKGTPWEPLGESMSELIDGKVQGTGKMLRVFYKSLALSGLCSLDTFTNFVDEEEEQNFQRGTCYCFQ